MYTFPGAAGIVECQGTALCQCADDDAACFNSTSLIGTCTCITPASECPAGSVLTGCDCILNPNGAPIQWNEIADFGGGDPGAVSREVKVQGFSPSIPPHQPFLTLFLE